MKKIALALLLILSFAGISASAQNTTCNAGFNFTYQNANTLQFNPVMPGTSGTTQHYWLFGDGGFSNATSPVHSFLTGSVFTVEHIIILFANGAEICRDSAFMTVQVQSTCNLTANFVSTITSTSPFTFHFENTSTPINNVDSVFWTFGDGSSSSNNSPNHTYTQPGTYTVCLRVQQNTVPGTAPCVSEICHTVTVPPTNTCSLIVNFTSNATSAINTFYFLNTSTPLDNTDSIRWTFGDGSSSNQVSPSHTYAQAGTYNVCLRIQKRDSIGVLTNCVREICHTITIQSTIPCTLQASFYSYPDSLSAQPLPYLYHFVNTSVPLGTTDSIRWTFGDGTASNLANPTHAYAQPGTYTVCLRVQKRDSTGALTNCISETCHPVVVVQIPVPCTLVADFYSYQDTTAGTLNAIHFQNTSAPLNAYDSIRWTFGDGTSSSQVSPTHVYTQAGTYTVCLRVQKRGPNGVGLTNCISEICHAVVVQIPTTCTLVANFYSYQDTTAGTLNAVHFQNTSAPLNAYDSIRWTFGDGTSSNQVSPTHVYTQPGTYTVCLRVQKRGPNGVGLTNCISEICHIVVVNPVCNLHANYSWHADSSNNRLIYFSNQTISPTSGATAFWSFGDGSSSTAWNPAHQYAQPGSYYVCLRVQQGANCISYFCDTVIIQQPLPNCLQQSNFNFVRAANNNQLFYFTPTYINSAWQYTWTFGDGTGSHNPTVSHQYAQPGNYTACLTVYRDSGCASTTCKPLTALYQVNCNSVNVSYTYHADSLVPNRIYFQTISNFSVISETWTIKRIPANSGTAPVTLTQYNPVYSFHDTGYYQVCLRAVTSWGCVKEYCQVIHITQVVPVATCNLQPYPNPAHNLISVNVFLYQPQMIDVYIYNSVNIQVGQKHQQGYTGNNIVSLPIGNLAAGIYTMKVIHGNDICYAQFVKL